MRDLHRARHARGPSSCARQKRATYLMRMQVEHHRRSSPLDVSDDAGVEAMQDA